MNKLRPFCFGAGGESLGRSKSWEEADPVCQEQLTRSLNRNSAQLLWGDLEVAMVPNVLLARCRPKLH